MSTIPPEALVAAALAAIPRTQDMISEQLRRARRTNEDGADSTYMDGVIAAIEWITGVTNDPPMDD